LVVSNSADDPKYAVEVAASEAALKKIQAALVGVKPIAAFNALSNGLAVGCADGGIHLVDLLKHMEDAFTAHAQRANRLDLLKDPS